MKKALSLVFLLVFLFNVVGYNILFKALVKKATVQLDRRIDDGDYSRQETITIKVPLTLPYPLNQDQYQRATGTLEYEGEFYNLVKQKHERDTLFAVYIRNHEEKRLLSVMTDFARASNDLPTTGNKAVKLFGSLIKDYFPGAAAMVEPSTFVLRSITNAQPVFNLIAREITPLSPPPEVV